jgi:hypothetical protein
VKAKPVAEKVGEYLTDTGAEKLAQYGILAYIQNANVAVAAISLDPDSPGALLNNLRKFVHATGW